MKYSKLFLALMMLIIVPALTGAQEVVQSDAPVRQLPAKQVVLLYELPELLDEPELLEEPDQLLEDDLDNQVHNLKVLLHLFSTAHLSKIHVKVGTVPGSTDFASHTFDFDEKTGEDARFSYARDGKTILLGLGQTKGMQQYHAEVVLESRNGQLSEARYFGPQ